MTADPYPICRQCGVQFDLLEPVDCPVCRDDRQYVRWDGQAWISMPALADDHENVVREEGPGIVGIGTEPSFAIGQRALLVATGDGNLLWDCISLFDDATAEQVTAHGGLQAIALSHPHFYGSMVTWSDAFGGVPIYIHRADAEWVPRQGNIVLWDGATHRISDDATLINAGVHFPGGTVLHRSAAAARPGAVFSGDIFQVVMDRRYVSFMYSYPNLIPERPETIRSAIDVMAPFEFDDIYGGWWRRVVRGDAKSALFRSARRYLDQVGRLDALS